ncbi:SdpI family protein [Tumebacillus sp. ITR2]|uniref:SdpI family protein n=1 Tax=Tumebacillus amylolyticus TaxID=2801339 RepID=A0ABS1J607_9BACL|nr:SdpI family protein [Tumebacillus amylolyticus]MBL0385718.1 SdpI family protein [Tumebacillus amylolyticus]
MKSKIKWGWRDLLLAVIGLLPIVYFALVYGSLPDSMATHFGLGGDANGWESKGTFLGVSVLLTLGVPLFMKVTRRIDPRSENYDKFDHVYEIFRMAMTLFLSAVVTVVVFYNLGYDFNMQMFAMIGLGLFLILTGNYMGQVRYNYFVGIKTPWTLANEDVWKRTHRANGPLIVITGLVALVCAFLPGDVAAWVFGVVFAGSMLVFPFLYSYLAWKKLMTEGK